MAAIFNNVQLGEGVQLGKGVRLGEGVQLGDGVQLGEGAYVPKKATSCFDLGFVNGYRRVISNVDGVAIITAGCREFNLKQAIKHWSTHSEDRRLTMFQMQMATSIAKMYGWRMD